MPEGRNYYLETIARLEPDIAHIDLSAASASIAISLRRIADAMEQLQRRPADPLSSLSSLVTEAETGRDPTGGILERGSSTRGKYNMGAWWRAILATNHMVRPGVFSVGEIMYVLISAGKYDVKRTAVSAQLRHLIGHGVLERAARNKYKLTPLGLRTISQPI